jgi:hypothetical protein
MKILLDGILESLNTRMDGSVKVNFATQELDSSKGGELFQLRGKYCKMLLSDTNITNLEQELVDKETVVGSGKKKSQAQRLRAVLFRVHEQEGSGEFDSFYQSEMERIIEHYKGKLQ